MDTGEQDRDPRIKRLTDELDTEIIGRVIYFFNEVGSTNQRAMELLQAGEEEGTVVISAIQTNGRGRLDRTWTSPKGGVYLSIILKPSMEPDELVSLPLVIGLGICRVLRNLGLKAAIKWPNDVLVNEKKIAGILIEAKPSVGYVIVGVGVNLNMAMDYLEPELRGKSTSASVELEKVVNYHDFLATLLKELDDVYLGFVEKGFEHYRKQWLRHSTTVHRRVRVETAAEDIIGTAEDIDRDGALLVREPDGKTHRIVTGDCIHLAQ
jgi:BirA family biotin operon repressor/biotin-[acetyl-CoA-carboxylase] ligase